MRSLSLLHYSDRRLKQKANDVALFDQNLQSMIAALLLTMEELHLTTICGPQVGIPERIMIIADAKAHPVILINPELIQSEGEITVEEGSNIFPHIVFNTARKQTIKVAYNDVDGAVQEQEFTDYEAVQIQQHLDHFKGKLLIDFMSGLKKERFLKQYEKMLEGGACHHGCSH